MEHTEKRPRKISPKALLLVFFVIGILCFGTAAVLSYQLASKVHQDQFPTPREASTNRIESWMTIRYISHTYHVPEQLLTKELDITEKDARKDTLERLAEKKGMATDALISEVKQILLKRTPPRPPLTK